MSVQVAVGDRFGLLVILAVGALDATGRHGACDCACDCGREFVGNKWSIASGRTKSCGCLRATMLARRMKANAKKKPARVLRRPRHGHCKSPTYRSWMSMIQRCTNPKSNRYAAYGARGITVCERWRAFANFLADMGERPVGKTLDRKKNDLGYDLDNCRWATPADQARNTRANKLNDRAVAEIRALFGSGWTRRHLADLYTSNPSHIASIIRGERWSLSPQGG